MRKLLDEIGPLLAGFQIAVSIVGFFGIGAIAKWILNHWLPFTRWVWTEFFAFIQLPEITTEEKDALTTLAFFAPMAFSSLLAWHYRKVDQGQEPAATEIDMAKEIRLRVYAAIIGATFMIIVGGSVIQDALTLFTTDAPESAATSEETPMLDIEAFARLGLLAAALLAIAALTLALYWISRRNKTLQESTDRFLSRLGKYARPVGSAVSSAALAMVTNVIASLLSLVSFATTFGGIFLAAGQLGPIRTVAPLLVLLSLLATVFLNPARLLKTAGVVIALVLASLGWDVAVAIVNAVENAPA